MESEKLLRAVFVPGQVYSNLRFVQPAIFELVAINGVERIRGYYITNTTRTRTPFFRQRSCRLRAQTVYEWERFTGERLTSDLQPLTKERNQ